MSFALSFDLTLLAVFVAFLASTCPSHEGTAVNHEDLVFTSTLTQINYDLARYLRRVLELDPTITEYTVPLDVIEKALGSRMIELGHKLKTRASQQTVIIEGEIEALSARVVP